MIRWILPFFLSCLLVKVLNEINPFSTLICWILPAWNRVSLLIYPAVWLTFCRGLPLTGSELHGNLYFFIFCKPGSFFINVLSLTNELYSGMKNKLSLGLSDRKKFEENWCVIDPCGYHHWPLFSHFSRSLVFHFCIFLRTQGWYFVYWIHFWCKIPVYLL